jgi:hypothetical protein
MRLKIIFRNTSSKKRRKKNLIIQENNVVFMDNGEKMKLLNSYYVYLFSGMMTKSQN